MKDRQYKKFRPTDVEMRLRNNLLTIILIGVIGIIGPGRIAVGSDRDNAERLADKIGARYEAAENEAAGFNPEGGLEEYLIRAARQNPGLKAAFYTWRAELQKVSTATALPDPAVSYGYFMENVETRVGPQRHRVGLKQTFPWFGTLGARGDIALEAARAAFEKYQSQKLELFYRLKRAYYDYYLLGRQIELTRENMDLLTFWEAVSQTRYRADLEKHPDLIRIQVEMAKLENSLINLENKIEPVVSRLRAILDLPDTVQLPIPTNLPANDLAVSGDSIIAVILANNHDLRAMEHMAGREKAAVRLAGKSWYPDFTFGVDYVETGRAMNPGVDESGKDSWMVSVSVNLPLWFGKNRAMKDETVNRHRSAQNQLLEKQNTLTAYAKDILYKYENSRREVHLYQDGLVPKAQQSLNVSYTAYQAGELDFLSLLDAQRLLLDFQLGLEHARTEAATRLAELDMLAGIELEVTNND